MFKSDVFASVFLLAHRVTRVYLGKVKKSQGVICRISALKFQIKIRWAIWPPPILNRVKDTEDIKIEKKDFLSNEDYSDIPLFHESVWQIPQ